MWYPAFPTGLHVPLCKSGDSRSLSESSKKTFTGPDGGCATRMPGPLGLYRSTRELPGQYGFISRVIQGFPLSCGTMARQKHTTSPEHLLPAAQLSHVKYCGRQPGNCMRSVETSRVDYTARLPCAYHMCRGGVSGCPALADAASTSSCAEGDESCCGSIFRFFAWWTPSLPVCCLGEPMLALFGP